MFEEKKGFASPVTEEWFQSVCGRTRVRCVSCLFIGNFNFWLGYLHTSPKCGRWLLPSRAGHRPPLLLLQCVYTILIKKHTWRVSYYVGLRRTLLKQVYSSSDHIISTDVARRCTSVCCKRREVLCCCICLNSFGRVVGDKPTVSRSR